MPINETIHSIPVRWDRSNRNSLTTVAASSAPLINQNMRLARRIVQIIIVSAHRQNTDIDARTSMECDIVSS